MVDMRLNERFTVAGKWWLPNSDGATKEVYGELNFDPQQGLLLKLTDDLGNRPEGVWEPAAIICGVSEDTKPCTLVRNRPTGYKINLPMKREHQTIQNAYASDFLFVGPTLQEKTPELSFRGFQASFTAVDEWMRLSPFDVRKNLDEHFRINVAAPINLQSYEPVNFQLASLGAYLNIAVTTDVASEKRNSIKFETKVAISLITQAPVDLDFLYKALTDLRDFFSLVTGDLVSVSEFHLFEPTQESTTERLQLLPYQVLFAQEQKSASWQPELVSYFDVEKSLEKVVNTWFQNAELLRPVYDILYGLSAGHVSHPRFHFLALMQALESLHRRKFPDSLHLDSTEFEEHKKVAKEAIPSSIPQKIIDGIKQCLGFANELGLSDRIKSLLEMFDVSIRLRITGKYGELGFVQALVQTRNYYTHYGEPGKKVITNEFELHALNRVLSAFLRLCLLKLLDIPVMTAVNGLFPNSTQVTVKGALSEGPSPQIKKD